MNKKPDDTHTTYAHRQATASYLHHLVFGFILLYIFIILFVAILVKPNKLETLFRLEPEHVIYVSIAYLLSSKDLLELINELLFLTGFDELVVCLLFINFIETFDKLFFLKFVICKLFDKSIDR